MKTANIMQTIYSFYCYFLCFHLSLVHDYANGCYTHCSTVYFIYKYIYFVDLGNLASQYIISFQDSVVSFMLVTHDLQFSSSAFPNLESSIKT
jgi:hypothetical protein